MATSLVRRVARYVFLSDAAVPVGGPAQSIPTQAVSVARYGWRLVAANNRALGRGTRAEVSYAQCRESAQRVHDGVAGAETSVHFDPGQGQWSWRVALGGLTVAVCVHPYLRRVECQRGLAQFIDAARAVHPHDGVIRYFGPRSLRGYDAPLAVVEP